MEYIRCPRCKNDVPITYLFCPYCGYDLRFILRERLASRLTFKDRLYRIYYLIRNPFLAIKHIASAPDLLGAFLAIFVAMFALFLKEMAVLLPYGGISLYSTLYLLILAFLLELAFVFIITLLLHIALLVVGGRGLTKDLLCFVGYTQIFFALAHLITIPFAFSNAGNEQQLLAMISGAHYVYIPIYLFSGILIGYGVSFTHLLKKLTAIGATLSTMVIFILFFYVL